MKFCILVPYDAPYVDVPSILKIQNGHHFKMAAPQKLKKISKKFIIAPIFMKLGRIIEIEESHNMAAILDCYGGHFESKMAAKTPWGSFGSHT